ncbi:MAG TPA: hypothetical protein VF518_04660, partial [Polyangia bacterium]
HDASAPPAVPQALAADFESKLLRTYPGYQPSTREEILLAVREIVLLPRQVVLAWLPLLPSEREDSTDDPLASLVAYTLPGATQELVADLGDLPRLLFLRGVGHDDLQGLRSLLGGAREPIVAHLRAHPYGSDSESASTLVADYLRSRAPVSASEISDVLGLGPAELPPLLDELLETETIVSGSLLEGRADGLFCDAENAERLLRLHRATRRAGIQRSLPTRPIEDLPHFLAEWQGLARDGSGLEPLQGAMDRLFGFPLPAELWEEAILPSRLATYYPSWLDTLFQSYGLMWLGCGKGKLSLAISSDRELLSDSRELPVENDGPQALVARHLQERPLGFFDLATTTALDTAALAQTLWDLAWGGRGTTDSYETVRRGILNGFSAEELKPAGGSGRAGFRRWERSRPTAGSWRLLPGSPRRSPVENAELEKERARLVLARYGVVFRELLQHELPLLRWPRLFRALRLLELSGEIVAGHFFASVPGIQFATHEAVGRLREPLPDQRLYFINACDPGSVCGLGLAGFPPELPRRIASNWMVFCGPRLVLVSQKGGHDLTVSVEPGDPVLAPALAIFPFFLGREFSPVSSVTVETVNRVNAGSSPYANGLREIGFANDYRGLTLWRK